MSSCLARGVPKRERKRWPGRRRSCSARRTNSRSNSKCDGQFRRTCRRLAWLFEGTFWAKNHKAQEIQWKPLASIRSQYSNWTMQMGWTSRGRASPRRSQKWFRSETSLRRLALILTRSLSGTSSFRGLICKDTTHSNKSTCWSLGRPARRLTKLWSAFETPRLCRRRKAWLWRALNRTSGKSHLSVSISRRCRFKTRRSQLRSRRRERRFWSRHRRSRSSQTRHQNWMKM